MFEPYIKSGKILGFAGERAGCFYFFGTRHLPREELTREFPQYEFCFLHQVHGDQVITAEPGTSLQADAHFTSTPGLALVSQTADCVPILLQADSTVCAVHSGWRGAALNIAGKAAKQFRARVFAAIGPHILAPSFEVGADVAKQLAAAAPNEAPDFRRPLQDGKFLFDLRGLVQAQLRDAAGTGLEMEGVERDTKTDLLFHSYRRDAKSAGRQYSFVVIKP